MNIELNALHWIYAGFIGITILLMIFRRDTTLACIIGIFSIALAASGSASASISSIFNGFIFAITELLSIIIVISIIVSMSRCLMAAGINEVMISPFTAFMKSPGLAYWTIGIVMMTMSWFFWPSPAVALMGAVLLPAALRVGLPALGAAVAMNLFGHGIALSGDFIIQAAPKLSGDAAGVPVQEVMQASIPLIIVMGTVTTFSAFLLLRRDLRKGTLASSVLPVVSSASEAIPMAKPLKKLFAILVPLLFALDIAAMTALDLQGSDATALVGGTSIFILLVISLCAHSHKGLEMTTKYLIDGFQFGFKVFGPVIPIAAFFYVGSSNGFEAIIGDYLPSASTGIVNDLGGSLAQAVPLSSLTGVLTVTGVGIITGLDGSGFSGLPLTGSIAGLFSTTIGSGAAVLTALGQITTIWVGGGTIVPWALIPAAAICNVDAFELARRNLIPVCLGLAATVLAALILM